MGFISASLIAAAACTYACSGGDDSNGGGDTSDSGPGADATTLDGSSFDSGSKDSGSGGDGAATDSGVDAALPPAHRVFVTGETFDGNLIGAAYALATDAGVDAGLDGGAEQYRTAADALCNASAAKAGVKGTFVALVNAGADKLSARVTDADGPWALVDGTPVADGAKSLVDGIWRHTVDTTAEGAKLPYDDIAAVWTGSTTGGDCNAWTSSAAAVNGLAGSYENTSGYAFNDYNGGCNEKHPLYCAEVGPGAGPNRYAAIPAGGKRVFYIDKDIPTNFAAVGATLVDASAPDAGDAVHTYADELCKEAAHAGGLTGSYHAWISSSKTSAKVYFTSVGMTGPWYRVDGAEVAASIGEITSTGARTQVETTQDGGLAIGLQQAILTGTEIDGGSSPYNCNDFTVQAAGTTTVYGRFGRPCFTNIAWASDNVFQCAVDQTGTGGLACFEE